MADDFVELEAWAAAFVEAMAPAARGKLMRGILRDLRRSQTSRIAAQQNPDGTPYTPRKPQAARFAARKAIRERGGGVRRRAAAMFRRLRTAAFLKGGIDADGVWVGFTGRTAAIARVHQEGGVDRTSPEGPRVRYPARELLGFTEAEREAILDAVIAQADAG